MPGVISPLRIGLLGFSDIARRRFAPALATCNSASLAAIGTSHPDTARSAQPSAAICTYDELIARPDIDLVYISLPNHLHEHWACRAAGFGKHILCEKPMATTREGVEHIIAMARASGTLALENLMFLHHPQHTAVKNLLATGRIGALRSIRSVFTFNLKPDPANFRNDPARGGGACADLLTYTVGTAELFNLGELHHITGTITHRNGLDIAAQGTARLRDDVRFDFSIAFNQPYESAYELTGETGTLRLDRAYTTPPELANTLKLRTATGEESVALPAADHFAETIHHVARLIAANDFDSVNAATLHRHQTIARIKSSLRPAT